LPDCLSIIKQLTLDVNIERLFNLSNSDIATVALTDMETSVATFEIKTAAV